MESPEAKLRPDPVAQVYITPPGGVGGEFPTPIPFNLRKYNRSSVLYYAAACEVRGYKVRIEWPKWGTKC